MDADQILVLDRGKVAEQGTHAELIEAGGLYASMWCRQQDFSLLSTPRPSSPGVSGTRAITPVPTVADISSSSIGAGHRSAEDSSAPVAAAAEASGMRRGPVKLLLQEQEQEAAEQQELQQGAQQRAGLPPLQPMLQQQRSLRPEVDNPNRNGHHSANLIRGRLRGSARSDTEGEESSYDGSLAGTASGGSQLRGEDSIGSLTPAARQLTDGSRNSIQRHRMLRRNDTGGAGVVSPVELPGFH